MNKKNLLITFFLLACFLGLNAQTQPNILFLNVDDLKPMLGPYDYKDISSPNIDRLAKNGVVFENAYCQQAVCAPSRISLLTGLRPDKTKVWDLRTFMRDMNPDVVTLPQIFKQNGYETVGYGKIFHGARNGDQISWTIPYEKDDKLTYADGFDYPASGKYQAKEIHEAYIEVKNQNLNYKQRNRLLRDKGFRPSTESLDVPDDAYEDGAIAVQAMKQLEHFSKSDKPFFLALGFHKPHLPFVAPKKYWDLYDRDEITLASYQKKAENAPPSAYHTWGELRNYSDIPREDPVPEDKQRELIHAYKACVSYIDAQIGMVMNKLDKLGLRENTIVILWGDHGWHLGDHGLWCKHSNFEQATRVPLIISAPSYLKHQKASTMAELVDIYPTLTELAGFHVGEHLEGKSLVPALKDANKIIKDYAISQYPRGNNKMGYSIRTNRYRLTLWLQGKFYKENIISNPDIIGVELYDYQVDPLETKSLVNETGYEEIKEKLQKKLLGLLEVVNK